MAIFVCLVYVKRGDPGQRIPGWPVSLHGIRRAQKREISPFGPHVRMVRIGHPFRIHRGQPDARGGIPASASEICPRNRTTDRIKSPGKESAEIRKTVETKKLKKVETRPCSSAPCSFWKKIRNNCSGGSPRFFS